MELLRVCYYLVLTFCSYYRYQQMSISRYFLTKKNMQFSQTESSSKSGLKGMEFVKVCEISLNQYHAIWTNPFYWMIILLKSESIRTAKIKKKTKKKNKPLFLLKLMNFVWGNNHKIFASQNKPLAFATNIELGQPAHLCSLTRLCTVFKFSFWYT